MIGFKISILLTRLADTVLNKIGIHAAIFKREFFFSVFKAISVIAPGNKQNYTTPKALRFCNKIILNLQRFAKICQQNFHAKYVITL